MDVNILDLILLNLVLSLAKIATRNNPGSFYINMDIYQKKKIKKLTVLFNEKIVKSHPIRQGQSILSHRYNIIGFTTICSAI